MKKSIIAAGLATALAATSFASSAMADPGPHFYHHGYYHHDNGGFGAGIVAGTVFGLLGSAIASNAYNNGPYYDGPPSRDAWCEAHYRTYNAATGMFYARPGVLEVCHSPYD